MSSTVGPEIGRSNESQRDRLRSTLAARIDLQLLELSAITARVRRFRHELDPQTELAAFAVLHDATSALMTASRQLAHARAFVEVRK